MEITFPDIDSFLILNCYDRFLSLFLSLFLSMPSKKSKKKFNSNIISPNEEKKTTPRTAKIVLFVFGVGPLLLMCLFLFSNGFFNSPL